MKVLSIVCLAISVLQIQGASSLRGRKLVKDTEKPLKDGLLCGSIITVSTKLDTDLICDCTSASALTLSGEEINLDLGLHTVTCNAGSRDAIAVSGKANVVRNGSGKSSALSLDIPILISNPKLFSEARRSWTWYPTCRWRS